MKDPDVCLRPEHRAGKAGRAGQDCHVSKRPVCTFFLLLAAIIRHCQHGLLLSEPGAFITGIEHAPAGTKRLSNLLRSPRWGYTLINQYLSVRADARLCQVEAAQDSALLLLSPLPNSE